MRRGPTQDTTTERRSFDQTEPFAGRRFCETFTLPNGYSATVGRYDDGRAGEVSIDGPKAGSDAQTAAKDAAVVLSMALQFGVPVDALRNAISRNTAGRPQGVVGVVLDALAEVAP